MSAVPSKRQARRDRNREDFVRATTQRLEEVGQHKHAISGTVGACAGNTYREHLEDKLSAACLKFKLLDRPMSEPGRTLRGVIRGLAMALALYEDSYNYSTQRVIRIEKEFLK